MMKNIFKILVWGSLALFAGSCQTAKKEVRYPSYKGLVMAGYQAWFNTPTDGMDRGWTHYNKQGKFEPECSTIDYWPDVTEYEKVYATDFKHADSTTAYVYSSIDSSTVDLHFSWMKKYGIDGVFLQRFISQIRPGKGKIHCDKALQLVSENAKKYDRAYCVMYDLSGMRADEEQLLIDDMSSLDSLYGFSEGKQQTYLHHNGKPLVAVWGVGFNDNRPYGYKEAEIIIDSLKAKGFSILLGVPTWWRELKNDALPDPKLHELIKKCDIILPWFVGRYNLQGYPEYQKLTQQDVVWCKQNHVDYVPLAFPGFSWKNMNGPDTHQTSRENGDFLWAQMEGAVSAGAEMLYVAMFDEVDEGTAIFKCLNKKNVPLNGKDTFEGIEDHLPTDHYLWLTGQSKRLLNGELPVIGKQPQRN